MHGHKNIPSAPIRYFLALLWAHPILPISTIRVKLLVSVKYTQFLSVRQEMDF